MWSSPALFGPQAKWLQVPSLLITNRTVLDGKNGLPLRPSMTEMVTSDFFPLQNHPKVNAVFITSRYDKNAMEPGVKPDPDGDGFWNYLMAYVGYQAEPGQPMMVLHRVCLDWSAFVRTSGWHGVDAATDAGTTFGIGKSMRSAEGKGDTGRRVLFAWMTNGYWDGSDAVVRASGLPKDSLSLPRDMTFAPDGRLLQKFVPELATLRVAKSLERLPLTALSDAAPVWFKAAGRQLEIFARFQVTSNCSFGLYVLASKSLAEYTTIGVDIRDDVTYVDRRNSSGPTPLVPSRGVLDVRAGLLPPAQQSVADAKGSIARTIHIHVFVDGPIVTFIVCNETALSVYVYPQLQTSGGVGLWSSGGTGAVRASADVWQLRSPFPALKVDDLPPSCAIIEQSNIVSGTQGLSGRGSTKVVKYLGTFAVSAQCAAACLNSSTAQDPCRSWAFYYPDGPQTNFAGNCFGRHDNVWPPKAEKIPRAKNHVCTAKSCKYPPLPPYSPPPPPPKPLPPTPPLPRRLLAPVDPNMLPIMYLGGINSDGNTSSDFSRACRFQVVAIINSYCWQDPGRHHDHLRCTNQSAEFKYIVAQSQALQAQCPGVLTQMYLNSLMNFWWYTSIFKEFDPAQGGDESLLLHDAKGQLVRVTQDGGNPNMTVYDFGQNATRDIFMQFVDKALASGISSFFLDKASISAKSDGQICEPSRCAQLTPEVAQAWSLGHREVLRAVASRAAATGPTVGNDGTEVLRVMGGAHVAFSATKAGIESLIATQAANTSSAIGAGGFPFSTNGYAAFLVAYEQGRSFMWTYKLDPSDIWIEEFDHPLGAPFGPPAQIDEAGVYVREFAHATVSFDTKTSKGHFSWKSANGVTI
jgi:hypothetical protein